MPKNKNVNEQIEDRLGAILSAGHYFRYNYNEHVPELVLSALWDFDLDLDRDLINYSDESDYEDAKVHSAIVCTQAGLFFDIYICLSDDESQIEMKKKEDVSEQYPVKDHQRGIGVTDGWLYVEALRRMNESDEA